MLLLKSFLPKSFIERGISGQQKTEPAAIFLSEWLCSGCFAAIPSCKLPAGLSPYPCSLCWLEIWFPGFSVSCLTITAIGGQCKKAILDFWMAIWHNIHVFRKGLPGYHMKLRVCAFFVIPSAQPTLCILLPKPHFRKQLTDVQSDFHPAEELFLCWVRTGKLKE